MKKHRYNLGQSVRFTNSAYMRSGSREGYKVTRLLPLEGEEFEYRIKSMNEPYERVARESQLDPAARA